MRLCLKNASGVAVCEEFLGHQLAVHGVQSSMKIVVYAWVRCARSKDADFEGVTDGDVPSTHVLDYLGCCGHVLLVPGLLHLHACDDSQQRELVCTDAVS